MQTPTLKIGIIIVQLILLVIQITLYYLGKKRKRDYTTPIVALCAGEMACWLVSSLL